MAKYLYSVTFRDDTRLLGSDYASSLKRAIRETAQALAVEVRDVFELTPDQFFKALAEVGDLHPAETDEEADAAQVADALAVAFGEVAGIINPRHGV